MELGGILKTRIDSLYSELESINELISTEEEKNVELKKDIDLLRKFIMSVNRNSENIRDFSEKDLSKITELLLKYWDFSYEEKDARERLKVINLVLLGKHTKGLEMDLSNEQRTFLNTYINAANKCLELVTNKYKTKGIEGTSLKKIHDKKENDILDLEILFEKVSDPNNDEILTEEDASLVEKIANDENIGVNIRKQLLISFIKYNHDRFNNLPKEVKKVSIEEVIECFTSVGYGPNMISIIEKNKDEIIDNANPANISAILNYLDEMGIRRKFEAVDLLDICIYGTLESVRRTFEKIKSDPEKLALYISISPSVWINNTEKRTNLRVRKHREKTSVESSKKNTLYAKAHYISSEEVESNIKYLQDEGFNVSFENPQCKKTISTPNQRLRYAVEVYKEYGLLTKDNIDSFAISALTASNIADRLDNFTEIGLLNGHANMSDEFTNYLKYNASKILANFKDLFPILYESYRKNDANTYYGIYFSDVKKGSLNHTFLSDLNHNEKIMKTSKRIRQESDGLIETYIPRYEEYEGILSHDISMLIDETIFDDPEIVALEDNNRVKGNDKIYVIAGQVISRLKVLRNYSKIRTSNTNNEEALMYSIVRGSYLDENTFKNIASEIEFVSVLGGNHELFGRF